MNSRPRRLVPETVQTSGMDCGPAALRSLLAGMGIRASYGRLREACQTDVDGTAIEALEATARALGLDVAQLMLPADHVSRPAAGALPALAVARLPDGMPHFVIVWRRHGPFVQVMDPAIGRRFLRARDLLGALYIHEQPVPAAAWDAFSESPSFREPLAERLVEVGLRRRQASELVARAAAGGPRALATLDAQARAAAAAGGRVSTRTLQAAIEDPDAARPTLPDDAWFARPLPADNDEQSAVLLRGAVLVRARGYADDPPDQQQLPPELRAALTEPAPRPARRLLTAARAEGRVPLAGLVAAAAALAGGAIAEIALLRGVLNSDEPSAALATVAAIVAALLAIDAALAGAGLAVGRRLEVGLRRALLTKLPRLPDRYLRSRAPSDMAERVHVLHALRTLPLLGVQLVSAALETVLVAAALCVLHPGIAPFVAAATVVALGVAVAVQWPLREREHREREHSGALSQVTLDALLGVLPIRAHGGEAAMVEEQRGRLDGWRGAAGAAVRARTLATLAQMAFGVGLTIPIVVAGIGDLDDAPGRLLFVLWAVMLPFSAERVGTLALQWPRLRALSMRLAEPLGAPDAPGSDVDAAALPRIGSGRGGVEIALDGASVRATGHVVLQPTTLSIAAGEHVALVGTSGAGKSTLCSLVLGLLEPSAGSVRVEGAELDRAAARALWPSVAWVDSQVRIWNRSLADNVAPDAPPDALGALLAAAELEGVAARVDGEALGADGGLLSGGEGQRVRLARALARPGVRLAILDEALRGLDREQRHRLLERARAAWADATVLCATHDIEDALGFDRVIVMAQGGVVEDGAPARLLAAQNSRFAALLEAERELRAELDAGRGWRRLRVATGSLREDRARRAAADETVGDAARPPGSAGARAGAAGDDAAPRAHERDPAVDAGTHAAGSSPARVVAALLVFALATAARFAAFALSWALIGAAILDEDVDGSRLTAWALLVAATVPFATLATWAEGRVEVGLGTLLRHRVLGGAFELDAGWIRREGPGRVLGRTMEIDGIGRLAIAGGLDALTAFVQLAVAAVALLAVAPGRAVAALLAVVLAGAAVTAAVAFRRRALWTRARLAETDELLEAIAGQRTRLVQEPAGDGDRHAARLARYLEISRAADRPLALLAGALPRTALLAGLLALALAAGDTPAGDLATALGGLLLAAAALRSIAAAADTLTTAALARRALAPITAAAAGREEHDEVQARGERSDGATRLTASGVSVEREGRRVLHDVDIALGPGERVLLVGASGAGKSTLASALAGLLPTSAGTIALDGAELVPGTSAWRARVQLVPQHHDNHVLLAPLAFNILLGRGWPPTAADLRAAAELCHELELGPLLERMPAGIGQHVGETGWRLSQGERARLQLARALLADPDVLILDEPLGALDPATARLVLDVVRRRARTLVLVSQE